MASLINAAVGEKKLYDIFIIGVALTAAALLETPREEACL